MAESVLSKENLYPKMIAEIADYAILLMDSEGVIQNWNAGAHRIKGYTESEIVGKNFRIFYTETDRQNGKPNQLIRIAKEEGRAQDEGWRVRKDGSTFWGSITITAVHDEHGKLVGFSKVTRDLTERRQSEVELKEHARKLESKNRELEQFAYIASHDLQEPLRTVTTLTDLLAKNYADQFDEKGQQMMTYINQATGRMRQLIHGLLDYSRIGRESTLTSIDLNELMKQVKEDLSTTIQETKATINTDNLPTINGYEIELRMLFQNLISNAMKYAQADNPPVISISAEKKSNHWKFAVSDNGIGIPQEFQDKVFLIFQRLHTKDEYEGTGIGLAHCRKVVELHNGNIWVESIPNKGSVFYFTVNSNLIKN